MKQVIEHEFPIKFTVRWYNGYYDVQLPIIAFTEEEALEKAEKRYAKPCPFSMGQNPLSNCGIYDKPYVVDIEFPKLGEEKQR